MKLISSQSQNEWNTRLKKGDIGVASVRQYLEEQGYVIYAPITGGAHAFDMLAVRNKREVMIAEVKAKARRIYYPDTGINLQNYREYVVIAKRHNLKVFLFFVDEMLHLVYGNWLDRLETESLIEYKSGLLKYPMIDNGIIYFPVVKMIAIKRLTAEEVEQLKSHSQRSYSYDMNPPPCNPASSSSIWSSAAVARRKPPPLSRDRLLPTTAQAIAKARMLRKKLLTSPQPSVIR